MTGTLFLSGCLEQNLFPASSSAFHTQRSAVKAEMWPSVFLFTLHKKLMLNEISPFQLKREKTQFNVIYWFGWNIYLIGIHIKHLSFFVSFFVSLSNLVRILYLKGFSVLLFNEGKRI